MRIGGNDEEPIVEPIILLDEDFNEELPGNWEIIVGGDTQDTWSRVDTHNGNSLDGTPFMFVNSDAAGSGGLLMDEELRTPAINITSPQGHLILSFDHYYRQFGSSTGRVKVWDGNVWNDVKVFNTTTGSWSNPEREVIVITPYANEELRVSFHYNDSTSWAWYWAIDNVRIEVVE